MTARAMITAAMMFALASPAAALDNGLARTPPMGWNSWNKFGCNVSETLVRQAADAIAASGMRDAGYRYVVIDDCWQVGRNPDGTIQPDPQRFPSGMKALADYVHSKGLKFGLYSDAGTKTCGGRPGSKGHEAQDAKSYAGWGVDYLKYDWCNTAGADAPTAYRTMRDALAATGRRILFSICEWGQSKPATWAPAVGNMWRTSGDITAAFDREPRKPGGPGGPPGGPGGAGGPPPGPPPGGAVRPAGGPPPGPPMEMGLGVLQVLDRQAGLAAAAGPGGWNDPDMLEVGNGGMTADEQRAHFALWAMLAAPLIAGNDLEAMTPETRAILTDPEIIAIDQDSLGHGADRIRRDGDADIWARPLAGGGMAVALLNRGTTPLRIAVDPAMLRLSGGYRMRDVWRHADVGLLGKGHAETVAPHAAVILRLDPVGARS